jgi:release factor glutamine methyltransferase
LSRSIRKALQETRLAFAEHDINDGALDARLLLQEATSYSHDKIIARDTDLLTDVQEEKFGAMVQRRLENEPVSRILGRREFYGRDFIVTPDVLDPRPDTETLIKLCLDLQPRRILDLGAGSGTIILTLLAELKTATGVAVDVSAAALSVVASNATRLGVSDRVSLLQSDWFSSVAGRFDLIVSNPPYIPTSIIETLDRDVRDFDPALALDGGSDGLSPYRIIAREAEGFLDGAGKVAVEIGAGQLPDVVGIFKSYDFKLLDRLDDLGGHPRALLFVHT